MTWQDTLAEAERLWDEARHHDALQCVDRAALVGESGRYHAALLRGDILLDLGDPVGALTSYESIAEPDTPDPRVDAARGIALFELARFPEADNALRSALRGDPELGEAHFTLGLLYELLGNGREVEHFRLARHLDPERYAPAPQLGREEFERCIQDAVRELPAGVARALEGIGMVVQELPHPVDLRESSARISPRCLGLLVNTNASRSSPSSTAEEVEPVVVLFKRNLERATTSRDHLVAEIKLTILHEIGHALGLDEHEPLR